jgi:DNA-binding NtrC family response regulator
MNGFQLYERITKANPAAKVCLMSARYDHDQMMLPFDPKEHFIQKPFDVDDLAKRVARLLNTAA